MHVGSGRHAAQEGLIGASDICMHGRGGSKKTDLHVTQKTVNNVFVRG